MCIKVPESPQNGLHFPFQHTLHKHYQAVTVTDARFAYRISKVNQLRVFAVFNVAASRSIRGPSRIDRPKS
jgi:hypothetical protein